jgi:hypothetical protein
MDEQAVLHRAQIEEPVVERCGMGNGGEYEYSCCIGRTSRRQGGRCPSRHYLVSEVEDATAEYYRTVQVTKRVREAIWSDVRRDADERSVVVAKDIECHLRKIEKLEGNQARLVQLEVVPFTVEVLGGGGV